jgi:hypothetical protein
MVSFINQHEKRERGEEEAAAEDFAHANLMQFIYIIN